MIQNLITQEQRDDLQQTRDRLAAILDDITDLVMPDVPSPEVEAATRGAMDQAQYELRHRMYTAVECFPEDMAQLRESLQIVIADIDRTIAASDAISWENIPDEPHSYQDMLRAMVNGVASELIGDED